MLKRLRPIAIVPRDFENKVDIRNSFQEIIVELNNIATYWNNDLQPLVDSLPSGRTRVLAADRVEAIDPFLNGFDGSQFYVDSTATPQILGGFLYNLSAFRPKTVKEAIVDTRSEALSEIRQLRALIDALELSADPFDDTNIKNWVRRLAANTVSNDVLNASFNVGYFAGDLPTKTAEFSLHQRDVNLRSVLGISTADFSLTDPGFAATNYIDDMDIKEALVELDSQINGLVVGSTDLQEAYDNTGAGKEIVIAGNDAIFLAGSSDTGDALDIRGMETRWADNGAGSEDKAIRHNATYVNNGGGSKTYTYNIFVGGSSLEVSDLYKTIRLERTRGGAATDLALMYFNTGSAAQGSVTRAILHGGREDNVDGNSILWSLGNLIGNATYLSAHTDLVLAATTGDATLQAADDINLQAIGKIISLGTEWIEHNTPIQYFDFTGIWDATGWGEIALATGLLIRDADDADTILGGFAGIGMGFVDSADPDWAEPTSAVNGLVGYAASFYANGYAPNGNFDADGTEAAGGVGSGVGPTMGAIYKNTTLKAKLSVRCNSAGTNVIRDAFNIDTSDVTYTPASGKLEFTLLTGLENAEFVTTTVSIQMVDASSGSPIVTKARIVDTSSVEVYIWEWSGGAWDTSPGSNFIVNVEMI